MLHDDGYTVLKNMMKLDYDTKTMITKSTFRNIFNKKSEYGTLVYSSERQQSTTREKWTYRVTNELAKLLKNVNALDPSIHKITNVIALRSNNNCTKQVEHCDSANVGTFDRANVFPMACVVAIGPGTKMYVRSRISNDETCIHLDEGDILLFRGDVKHSGAEYKTQNVRLHAYIDLLSHKRKRNTTYL